MITINKCPVCLSITNPKHYLNCKDNTGSDEDFNIVECIECSFKYTSPIPSEEVIGRYYESDEYISHTNSNKGLINSVYQKVRNITLKGKLDLIQSLNTTPSLLDYGCGTGDFIGYCKAQGINVSGIEPSEQGRQEALKNYNIQVDSPDQINELKENQFNIITLWHVLEHIHRLDETITALKRILKSDGHLIIAVPNHASYDAAKYQKHWAAYDVPRHLYHFTPNDIKNLFARHELSLTKTLPMKWDSFYVSMLSEKYMNDKNNLLQAFFTGLKSNMKAKSSGNYSSLIYILKKGK